MMSTLQVGTMLAYAAGAALLVCVVLGVYWGMQRIPPGFGLWTASAAIIAAGCLILVDRAHFPAFVSTLLVPFAVILAAVLRYQGIQRFLGQASLAWHWLLLPVLGTSLFAVFHYGWYQPAVRGMILAVAITTVCWTAALALFRQRNHPRRAQYMTLSALLAVYGAVWLGAGINWLLGWTGFPTGGIDLQDVILLGTVTGFEFLWLVISLTLSARWRSDIEEITHLAVESERRQLAAIIASLPDAIFALDKEHNIVAWNRRMEKQTGTQAERVLGLPRSEGAARGFLESESTLSEILLDPTRKVPARYRNVVRGESTISAEQEWRLPGKPSRLRYFWHTAALIRDAEGETVGTIESIRDISPRVKVERALSESEDRYRSLFENNLDGVLVVAPGGTVVDANASACAMLGMTKREICKTEPGSLVYRAGDAERLFSSTAPGLGTALRQVTFVRGDGSPLEAECMYVVWDDAMGRLRAFVQFRDISERLAAQQILRESQERLLGDWADIEIGNWEIDLAAGSIWMSPEAMRIFGIEETSPYFPLDEGTLTDLAEDAGVLAGALEAVMKEGGSYDIEYLIKRASDGEVRTVHSIGSAVYGEDGVPLKIVGATQDISSGQGGGDAERMDGSPREQLEDQVYWVDPEGRITNVSGSACAQLGYTREELLGMTIYQVNPRLRPEDVSSWETAKDFGTRRFDTVHRAKNGRHIPVEVVVSYISHDGEDYKFVVARDVTERKRLEDTLGRAHLSLRQGGDMIFWADPEGKLSFAGESTCKRLGYQCGELLGMTISELDPGIAGEWHTVWAALKEKGRLTRKASLVARAGPEHAVEVSFTLVDHGGQEYALAVARDEHGDRHGMQALPRDALHNLQEQKLEAVGQLAGGIAHDFNNLLTAIIGYDNLILGGEPARESAPLRRDAEEIRDAAERAAALTSQILSFARRQPLRPERLRLVDLVVGMRKRLAALLSEDIELVMPESGEGGVVEVDRSQCEQVLENLVRNAREAMPDGGRVTIEAKNEELSEAYCRAYPELSAGSYVMVSVSDTGVGMDVDTRLRIFEPFFTTKPPGEGVGLGLSVVYGFVKQSGGHVVAYSEADRGTTLKVYLPRVAESSSVADSPAKQLPLPIRGSETVVVVEDEPPLRRLVARVLGDLGYRVLVAGNGPEALELLEDMEASPDMLITDVVLPGGIQGNELVDKATAMVPALPVLYMSGHPRDAIVHSGRLDEGVSFLGKPFTPQSLAAKVREVLGPPPS